MTKNSNITERQQRLIETTYAEYRSLCYDMYQDVDYLDNNMNGIRSKYIDQITAVVLSDVPDDYADGDEDHTLDYVCAILIKAKMASPQQLTEKYEDYKVDFNILGWGELWKKQK